MVMRRKRRRIIWTIVIGMSLLLGYMMIEPFWLRVTPVTIRNSGIPASFDGVTIAFLADMHRGPGTSLRQISRAVRMTNAQHPDMILLGGDYASRRPIYIKPCFAALAKLHAPLGVYGVLGNHDHWIDADLTRQAMADARIENIDNRALWIHKGKARIRLGGVGDLWTDTQDIDATIDEASPDDFVILVSHNPDVAETLQTDKVDLMLSGHTHGGQVTWFGRWAPQTCSAYGQKYRTGLVQAPHTKVLISNGIGVGLFRVRFFCRPEIVLITLRRS